MWKNYLKIAWKVLKRRKFFTFVSLFGITFTLLVLMVAASFLDHIALPARPGSRFDRTLFVARIHLAGEHNQINSSPSYYFLDRYVRPMHTPEAVSVHTRPRETSVYVNDRKLALRLICVDDPFWYIMEFPFLDGRAFGTDAVRNAERVAVISDRTQRQVFGGVPAVGKYLETTDGSYRVVGVIPAEDIPTFETSADIYVPITTAQWHMSSRQLFSNCEAFVLARSKDDFGAIRREYDQRLDQAREDYAGEFDVITCPIGTQADLVVSENLGYDTGNMAGLRGNGIWILLGSLAIVGLLFMLFPAINLVNLNISRIVERSSEIGVRKAFGASSLTLLGQFIVENVFLTLIGGATALVLTWVVLTIINNSGLIPFGHLELNLRVYAIAITMSLVFGLLSGALPAYRMSRLHPVEALRGGAA